jgi:LysR family glycine cleavage system transcriptional activator
MPESFLYYPVMTNRIPPLHALRAFEAFARFRNVAAAAEDLCVTHSAVIHQLKQLHDWMGVELIKRGARGLVLTEVGERYSQTICEAFQKIGVESRKLQVDSRHRGIRLSALPMFAVAWLLPRLPDFWAHYPEVELSLEYTAPSVKDFALFDLAVRHENPLVAPADTTLRLLDGAAVPVCSPSYLASHGRVTAPQDLLSRTLVHDEDRGNWKTWLSQAGLPEEAAERGPVFPDGNVTLASVLAGGGIGLLRRALLRDQFKAGTLVKLFDIALDEHMAYVLRWHSDRPLSREAETLRDWLKEKSAV